MQTYLRLLGFARPLLRFMVPYLIFTMFSTVFSLVNLSLLIPLLDILFQDEAKAMPSAPPDFALNFNYPLDLFYYYLDVIVLSYGKFGAIQYVCATLVISVFLSNIFRYLSVRVVEYLRAQTIENLRGQLFDQLTRLHLGFFSKKNRGDIMARLTTDVLEIEHSITKSLFTLFKEPLVMGIFFTALFQVSVKLTMFTIFVIPISGLGISYIVRRLRTYATRSQQSASVTTGIYDETLTGMRVIKAFNGEPYMRDKFSRENGHYARVIRRMANTKELASPFSEFMGVSTVALILLYGGNLVLNSPDELSPSQFIFYIALFSQILSPAKSFSVAISNIQRSLISGMRVFELLDAVPDIQVKEPSKPLTHFEEGIRFENVYFRYEEDWTLEDVNFHLEKGKSIALVGPSGSGKSTIADLIPRFYDVEKGSIYLDGVNIKDYSLQDLRGLMGIVTQDPILFHDTIFNNIAFAHPGADMEQVVQAAKIANAHEFIMQKEEGYQTVIGDRGVLLSGGQRQRLAIARAVFKNPPILILDEATSSLDSKSEQVVQDALNKLMENRTSLIIAHRLSTIQDADEILVVDGGQIRERGKHESLLANREGIYARLNLRQFT